MASTSTPVSLNAKPRRKSHLENKSLAPLVRWRQPDRFARMMSSQVKHWRIAMPGLPVRRFFGWIV
jgi:hypothetical protein